MLIALPAQSPCQPCFSITSRKLPDIVFDPTPTTIRVLRKLALKSKQTWDKIKSFRRSFICIEISI
ncbi:hypothetical protein Hanom_Chr14g01336281 [Helianthus anomalus]